jgi:hypothetical protein
MIDFHFQWQSTSELIYFMWRDESHITKIVISMNVDRLGLVEIDLRKDG